MDNFLLKITDENGEEVWNDKFKLGYVHLDSFTKFATKNNLSISLSTDETAALSLASNNYTSILNLKVGYLFALPENFSEPLINYLEEQLPMYQEEEKAGKIIEARLFSKEKVYYNHNHYRDLIMEEKIEMLEGKKKEKGLVTDLLKEEIVRQKELIESKKK